MQFNRWVTLGYSVLVSICASLTYIFGIYSAYLKTSLHFNQEQITLVGTLGNVAQFTGLPAGFVYDRYGPRTTIFVGGCLAFTGFSLLYLVTGEGWGDSVGVGTICALYSLACFSMSWYDTSNVITNVKNFPSHRGLVIGMSKSFNGLGAGIFAQIYLGFFKPHSRPFLLMVPIIAILVALGGMVFLNQVPAAETKPSNLGSYFVALYSLTALLAGYLASTALAQEMLSLSATHSICITYGVFAILALFWLVPLKATMAIKAEANEAVDEQPADHLIPVAEKDNSRTLLEALKGLELWLLFLAFFCGTGVGLMLINNIAQLSDALAGREYRDPNTRSVLVTLLAVGSTLGRLGCGALTEALRQKVPRTMFLTVIITAHAGIQFLLAGATHSHLYPYCFIAAVCYGGYWSLMPAICTDLFGVKHLGAIYNFLHFGTSFGTLVMSTMVAGKLYDLEAARQGLDTACYGTECYATAFTINAGVCAVGATAAAGLQFVSRWRYQAAK